MDDEHSLAVLFRDSIIRDPFKIRDLSHAVVVSVNAYGRNGMGAEALELFYRMSPEMRNDITYICVLNACSHAGFVIEARQIFGADPRNHSNPKIVTTMVSMFRSRYCPTTSVS